MTQKDLQAEIDRVGEQIDSMKQDPLARRRLLLHSRNIDAVLDVGANTGQYSLELRKMGWSGPIVSFEPLGSAYKALEENAKKDKAWTTHQYALGSRDASLKMNVSGDSRASSLLPILPAHIEIADYFKTVGTEVVQVRKLDNIIDECAKGKKRIYLKIDAQGYEKKILAGAKKTMARIQGLQLEMPLEPLYEGETPFEDMLRSVRKLGFRLMSLEYGFTNPKTGQLLYVDGIFFRDS
jgi:FkbM family methyltransferase